ncbi:MAG: glycosyltransferase, partial [Gammaproteobacteria bacterium]
MIVSAYFPPASSPGVHRVIRFARQLTEDAWPVSIITMDPDYFDTHVKNDETLLERVADGVTVHRTKVFRGLRKMAEIKEDLRRITKKPTIERKPMSASTAGTLLRRGAWKGLREWLIDIVQFPDPDIGWYWYALRRGGEMLKKTHVDVILSTAPPHTAHLIAARLSRRFNIAWVADFRDPMARIPFYRSRRDKKLKKALWERLEKRIVVEADAVILNTDRMKGEFENVYGERVSQKFYCVSNGFDSELFEKYNHFDPPQEDCLIITHAGSLYGSRNPTALFEALALAISQGLIPKPGIRLNLLGSYVRAWGLPEKVEELKLGSVVNLLAPVPHGEGLKSMAASHVLLVRHPESIIQVPAKLYEYMALR